MKLGIVQETKPKPAKETVDKPKDLDESASFDVRALLKAVKDSYFDELQRACRWHDAQYWLTAFVTNFS